MNKACYTDDSLVYFLWDVYSGRIGGSPLASNTRLAQRSWSFEAVNRRLADPVAFSTVDDIQSADKALSHGPAQAHSRLSYPFCHHQCRDN